MCALGIADSSIATQHASRWQATLVTALRPNVTLELHDVAGRIDQHETLMFVRAVRKSNHGAHQELDAQFLYLGFHSGKVFAV